jgi:L-ribulokinase
VAEYPHGVIDATLPGSGARLGHDWALQHPGDYLSGIERAVPEALKAGGVSADSIVGIGVDFTSSTILPVGADGSPLCFDPRWAGRPNAWVKLWKHHASQPQADRINALAASRGDAFLSDYGGRTSSEWLVAKALQTLDEDPDVYAAAARFVEAGDWLVAALTGRLVRNSCGAGYKGFWSAERGFPAARVLSRARRALRRHAREARGRDRPAGTGRRRADGSRGRAARPARGTPGRLRDHRRAQRGPGGTVVTPGRMVLRARDLDVPHAARRDARGRQGIGGVVKDGIVEGFYGYEAGQPAVGDIFGWFARMAGGDFAALERDAAQAPPGAAGCSRSTGGTATARCSSTRTSRARSSGLTLATTAADIYRALIEATAFSTRRILDAFTGRGIAVDELIGVGGLADRSPPALADLRGRDAAPDSHRGGARTRRRSGRRCWAAVAAGKERGGHASFTEAARAMARLKGQRVAPDPKAADAYDALYADWLELHDHFGTKTDVMKRLRGRIH